MAPYLTQLRHLTPLLRPQERSNEAGGDPNIRYYHSYWKLSAGEVLRIRARPPPCRCWNFQLNNHWMESLDYRYATRRSPPADALRDRV